jgi:hypothetical protein
MGWYYGSMIAMCLMVTVGIYLMFWITKWLIAREHTQYEILIVMLRRDAIRDLQDLKADTGWNDDRAKRAFALMEKAYQRHPDLHK